MPVRQTTLRTLATRPGPRPVSQAPRDPPLNRETTLPSSPRPTRTRPPARPLAVLDRRLARLVSGSILFVYLAVHLINHALGVASLELAEAGLALSVTVWHSLPGTVLLYGAAAVHIALAFASVYERRTLRLPPIELLRIAMGFGMPMLLIGHFAFTRLAWETHGLSPDYTRVVATLWRADSEGRQLALLVPGWIHGCLGLHLAWLRQPAYQRLRLPLFALALLLPVLAAIGFLSMGRALQAMPGGTGSPPRQAGAAGPPSPQRQADRTAAPTSADPQAARALAQRRDALVMAYLALLGAVLLARQARHHLQARQGRLVAISYPDRRIRVPIGWSVLEASRGFGLPHVSLCGGRSRCSTCRVRVVDGLDHCPPMAAAERETLRRVGAPDDVRLACQLRPAAAVSVIPLLGPAPDGRAAREAMGLHDASSPAHLLEQPAMLLLVDLPAPDDAQADRPAQDLLYAMALLCDTVGSRIEARRGHFLMAGPGLLIGVFPDAARALSRPVRSRSTRAGSDRVQESAALCLLAAAAIHDAFHAAADTSTGVWPMARRARLLVHHGTVAFGPVGHRQSTTRAIAGEGWQAALAARDAAVRDAIPGTAMISDVVLRALAHASSSSPSIAHGPATQESSTLALEQHASPGLAATGWALDAARPAILTLSRRQHTHHFHAMARLEDPAPAPASIKHPRERGRPGPAESTRKAP